MRHGRAQERGALQGCSRESLAAPGAHVVKASQDRGNLQHNVPSSATPESRITFEAFMPKCPEVRAADREQTVGSFEEETQTTLYCCTTSIHLWIQPKSFNLGKGGGGVLHHPSTQDFQTAPPGRPTAAHTPAPNPRRASPPPSREVCFGLLAVG